MKEQIEDLITTFENVIEEIYISGGTPYLKALQHCLVHVANGGTISNFKPLVRTVDYAGLDRRQPYQENALH